MKDEQISYENTNSQLNDQIKAMTKERDVLKKKISDVEKNFEEINSRLIAAQQEKAQVKKNYELLLRL